MNNLALVRQGSEVMAEEGRAIRKDYINKMKNDRHLIRNLLFRSASPQKRLSGVRRLPIR